MRKRSLDLKWEVIKTTLLDCLWREAREEEREERSSESLLTSWLITVTSPPAHPPSPWAEVLPPLRPPSDSLLLAAVSESELRPPLPLAPPHSSRPLPSFPPHPILPAPSPPLQTLSQPIPSNFFVTSKKKKQYFTYKERGVN